MRFSERERFKPVRSALQIDSVDDALRNSLWSVLHTFVFSKTHREGELNSLMIAMWLHHYKLPLDRKPENHYRWILYVRDKTFGGAWYEIYDLIEFVLSHYRFLSQEERDNFVAACNNFLERELSAYRIVEERFARLTSDEEIAAVEQAANSTGNDIPVVTHIRRALELLSDRKTPDYRNSIKEAISAVESVCAAVTGQPKSTLGDALKQLEKKGVKIHPALRGAFTQLYGYTSDAEGIRHALLDEATLDFEDAKFMLVSCAAFVNLLRARSGN